MSTDTEPESAPSTGDAQAKAASKLPACADCKRLKVKCVRSDPNNPNSVCQRCLKKNINCLVRANIKRPLPPLEKMPKVARPMPRKRRVLMKDCFREQFDSLTMRDQLLSSWKLLTARDDLRLQLMDKHESVSLARPSNNALKRGLLTREQVLDRLAHYRKELYPRFPIVEGPTEENMEMFMNDTPILFHTILDIGSIVVNDHSQLEPSVVLHNLVLRTVVDEIMIVSVKNMELLKCLTLLTHWYNESELYHQQRLHVLTALAVSISYDLGLGGTAIVPPGTNIPAFEQMVSPQASTDYHSFENYRMWLAVYSALFQVLMANRRPVKSLWSKYSDDAVASVMNDARTKQAAGNSVENGGIWELAKLRNIQERVAISVFKRNNDPVPPSYADPVVLYNIQQFDTEIQSLKDSITHLTPRCELALNLCILFLHQAVLYGPYDETIGRAPFTNFSLNILSGPLSYQEERSFGICARYTQAVLDKVNLRTPNSIASETSDFWTSMTLCCDILLKCRSCCIFNRNYASVQFVSDSDLARIVQFTGICDKIVKEYPNCNNAVSFGFFVKLILCHHDARIHYHSSRVPLESFGDPLFVMHRSNMVVGPLDPAVSHDTESVTSEEKLSLVDHDYQRQERDQQHQQQQQQEQQQQQQQQQQQRMQQQQEQQQQLQQQLQEKQQQLQEGQLPQTQQPELTISLPPEDAQPQSLSTPVLTSSLMDSSKSFLDVEDPVVDSVLMPSTAETVVKQDPAGDGRQADDSQQSYFASPFSPDSSEPMKNGMPSQTSQMDQSLDFTTLDFDLTTLNDTDNFWNNFVSSKGSSGPFGLDFPV